MQISKTQYNNVSINFGANLKITGMIEDISSRQLKSWERKAKSIGCENDIIEIEFGKPIDIDVMKKLPKPTNPEYIRSWRNCVFRIFGVRYSNSDSLFISKRNINTSAIFKDNKYSENIGYWCSYGRKAKDIDIQEWHIKTTKECVNQYFGKLKNCIMG